MNLDNGNLKMKYKKEYLLLQKYIILNLINLIHKVILNK